MKLGHSSLPTGFGTEQLPHFFDIRSCLPIVKDCWSDGRHASVIDKSTVLVH